ncbi:hypothetical protein ACFV4N_25970 [Actinosynnema sp. NPDC059797]
MNRRVLACTAAALLAAGCSTEATVDPRQAGSPQQTTGSAVPTEVPITANDAAATAIAALARTGTSVPDGWRPVSIRHESHDGRPVDVVRFQRDEPARPGGEHITVVVDEEATLLGYTRMVADAPADPGDADRARERALAWLDGFAADYATGLTVAWVDRHDETVVDPTGAERVVTGMKVKAHHDDGLYAWVIVDGAGRVVTYERDIRWDGRAGRRGTEMWLHDKWIAAHDDPAAPRPEAPYAVVG